MQRMFIYLLSCLLLLGVAACSQSDKDKESQTGEEAQSTGQKIAEEIKKPIDRANLAKELTEEHNQQIEANVKDQ